MDLEEEMRQRGLTVQSLAEKMGVREKTVRNWLKGQPMMKGNQFKLEYLFRRLPLVPRPAPRKEPKPYKPLWSTAEQKAIAEARRKRAEKKRMDAETAKRQCDFDLCTSTATFDISPGRQWRVAEEERDAVWWEPIESEECKVAGAKKYLLALSYYGNRYHAALWHEDATVGYPIHTDVHMGVGYLPEQAIEKLRKNALYRHIRIIYKGGKRK